MFIVNEDNSIYVNRGDIVVLDVSAVSDDGTAYMFQPGDKVRMKVFGKKDTASVFLCIDVDVTEKTEAVQISIPGESTKFEDLINKPKDYWYEIELNPDTCPMTIVGYDEDGAKVFRLYPEGADMKGE